VRRLNVLLSAYACEPGRGSEPAVGWNTARELASHHEVWVLTRANNRTKIEVRLADDPVPGLHFLYYDLPRWASWWKRGKRGIHAYYYLWQLGAYRVAKKLHGEVGIDMSHHVTFVIYWRPSLLALLPVPFVWGPVGGGEFVPEPFRSSFGRRGRIYEAMRDLARWLGELDPLVRATARRSALALATTEETAVRLRKLGAKDVRVFTQVGLNEEEIDLLSRQEVNHRAASIRFVSIGRALHWKGFHLGLRAFAQARLPNARYWVVGDGPERGRLQDLAEDLGIAQHVRFWGRLSRGETLRTLGECHVLVHPSLHESGGWVCLEAMALGRPVVCLDLGGPAVQVTQETGFRIPANTPEQSVRDLAAAMQACAADTGLLTRMGEAGQRRVAETFNWREKGAHIAELYRVTRS
jgi:glycosyltransferase involved in cell wall biosynthesis